MTGATKPRSVPTVTSATHRREARTVVVARGGRGMCPVPEVEHSLTERSQAAAAGRRASMVSGTPSILSFAQSVLCVHRVSADYHLREQKGIE